MINNENLPCVFPAPLTVGPLVEKRVMAELRRHAAYRAAVTEWFLHGDGRAVEDGGKGLAFPSCIHGTSRWTAYDNICGGCESGDGEWNYGELLGDIYRKARRDVQVYTQRVAQVDNFLAAAENAGDPLSYDAISALYKWAFDPIRN